MAHSADAPPPQRKEAAWPLSISANPERKKAAEKYIFYLYVRGWM